MRKLVLAISATLVTFAIGSAFAGHKSNQSNYFVSSQKTT